MKERVRFKTHREIIPNCNFIGSYRRDKIHCAIFKTSKSFITFWTIGSAKISSTKWPHSPTFILYVAQHLEMNLFKCKCTITKQ